VVILAILIVFTACHKKKKPFLLLPLIDNSSVASTDSGSGGPTFTPAQGILDDSFGAPNGYILQPVSTGSNSDIGNSLAIDKNGKILLGGYCWDTTISKYAFCIARFNPNGSLDNTFGPTGSGYIIQPIGLNNDYGVSLAIDKNDKILLGGYCVNGSNYDFCVARFKSDGSSLDNTFGPTGSGYIP
jgi:uncharacterized delta-60 repeat protein